MVWLRHSTRHIHATIADYLESQLTALGWTGSTPPFGAPPVVFQTFLPPESELTKVRPGLVAVTMGDQTDAEEGELGGPLHQQDIPIFVDCFMDKDAHCEALATDVRDIFRGRFNGGFRSMPVYDHSQDPATAVDGWLMEYVMVEKDRIDRLPVYWQVVRLFARVDFPEVVY